MYFDGIITKEEKNLISKIYLKTNKSTKAIYQFGRLFLYTYALICLIVLVSALNNKSGGDFLVFLTAVPITVAWLKYNLRTSKGLKNASAKLKYTDKLLGNADEYQFVADDEKVVVNEKVTLLYKDMAMGLFYNGYTVLTGKNKLLFIIKTDDEQQRMIYNILRKNKVVMFLASTDKKVPFANKKLLAEQKNTVKKRRAEGTKVLKQTVLLDGIAFAVMLVIAAMNNQSATDKNQYSFNSQMYDYPITQLCNEYSANKSYKSRYDIYFEWVEIKPKTVIAINSEDNVLSGVRLYYWNEKNQPCVATYSHSALEKTRTATVEYVDNWEEEMANLSDYEYVADNFPYILYENNHKGIELELWLRDKSIFTTHDRIIIEFSHDLYSRTEPEKIYDVYSSMNNVKKPEDISAYFNQLQKEFEKPYDEQDFPFYVFFDNISKLSGITVSNRIVMWD